MRTPEEIQAAMNTLATAFANPGQAPAAPAATATNAITANQKKSQYWASLGFISDLEKVQAHDLRGVAYLFESGFPVDNIKEKMESPSKDPANTLFNFGIQCKNEMRADIANAIDGLEAGDWRVVCLTDEPIEGDPVLLVRRLDPMGKKAGQTLEEVESHRTRVRKTF